MGFRAQHPATGCYGGLEVKPPAVEENLQFCGQNIAAFVYYLIDF